MSLIEQAAKRLAELRRAGAESPGEAAGPAESEHPDTTIEHIPTPEAAVRELNARATTSAPSATASAIDAPATEALGVSATIKPVQTVERKAGAATLAAENLATTKPIGRPSEPIDPNPPLAPQLAEATDFREVAHVAIDLTQLKARGFVTPDAPQSQIADEFRVIKRPIIRNAQSAPGASANRSNLVMVTSALPREGKTFTALNLAISIAMEMDSTVLLVDGDVAHPELPDLLGVPNAPGLLDVLTRDDIDVGDAIIRTNIEKLSVLPAGSPHRRATELLASEQMAQLLRELATRYADRIIVFDSPPLLATTEARVLASHMGQIVMVVAADSTGRHAVDLALATIDSCEIILMILNKADKTDVGTYYGYYADDEPN